MKERVAILLSSYNGEKYIAEQIDSLIKQTYPNIEIFVRDDGSSDNTLDILRKYESKKQITLLMGDNLGFIGSFFELLKYSPNADYYAWCDQDDVWVDNKIELAIDKLSNLDKTASALYFSDYDYYDSDMNFQKTKSYSKTPSFRNSLFDCTALGITVVFNKCLRDIIAENIPEYSCGHDWWAYLLCNAIGTVVHDPVSTVKYRQHSDAVSGSGISFVKFMLWRIKKFIVNDYFKNIRKQIKEFESLYSDRLSNDDLKLLKLFCSDKRSLKNVFKKMFYPARFRERFVDEVMLRFVFLFGLL